MLDHLFGSRSRAKIIKLFCTHHQDRFYVRELSRLLDIKLNALSRELANLKRIGFLNTHLDRGKKYYSADISFPLFSEVRALIIKSTVLLEKAVTQELRALKGLQLLLLTGIFIGQDTGTDILLVGTVDRKKVTRLMRTLSSSFHQEMRFTILSQQEYKYRKEVADKFLSLLLNAGPIMIVNKIAA